MRVLILIVALLWGGASWWWYTCNIKGYCDADTAQVESKKEEESKVSEEKMTESVSADAEADTEKVAKDEAEKASAAENNSSKETKDENASNSADETSTDVAESDQTDKTDTASTEDSSVATPDANETENADASSDNTSIDTADTVSQDATTAGADTPEPISTEEDIAQSKDNNDPTKIRIDLVSGSSTAESKIEKVRIYFPYNSSKQSNLSSSATNYFDKVVATLNADEAMKITLTGHTDSQGNNKRNKSLGLRRADMVKKMLVEKGAPASRIKTSSKGETSPIASNKSEAGRNKNRRVVLEPTT